MKEKVRITVDIWFPNADIFLFCCRFFKRGGYSTAKCFNLFINKNFLGFIRDVRISCPSVSKNIYLDLYVSSQIHRYFTNIFHSEKRVK
jgi:hypothetical protein